MRDPRAPRALAHFFCDACDALLFVLDPSAKAFGVPAFLHFIIIRTRHALFYFEKPIASICNQPSNELSTTLPGTCFDDSYI